MNACQECEILKDARLIALERCVELSRHAVGALNMLLANEPIADRTTRLEKALEISHPVSEAYSVLKGVRENLRQHEIKIHGMGGD